MLYLGVSFCETPCSTTNRTCAAENSSRHSLFTPTQCVLFFPQQYFSFPRSGFNVLALMPNRFHFITPQPTHISCEWTASLGSKAIQNQFPVSHTVRDPDTVEKYGDSVGCINRDFPLCCRRHFAGVTCFN